MTPAGDPFGPWNEWVARVKAAMPARAADMMLRDCSGTRETKGRATVVCSPLRPDKSPSFWIYDNGTWFDWGTHEGGDLIAYVQKRDASTFAQALNTIASFLGLETWEGNKKGRCANAQDPAELLDQWKHAEFRARVFGNCSRLMHLAYDLLPDRARDHLRDHYAFSDDTIDLEKIGYCPPGFEHHVKEILKFSDEEMLETGWFVHAGQREGIKAQFGGRIVFGYWHEGLCKYAIGREWHAGHKPLYVPPDWELGKYKKQLVHNEKHRYVATCISNEHFWNEDAFVMARGKILCIAEGITDAIMLKQIGFLVVSPVTTRFSEIQGDRMVVLARGCKEVWIFNDNDVAKDGSKPGLKGALSMAAKLWKAGYVVRIVQLPKPEGTDKIDVNELAASRYAAMHSEDES